MRVLTGILLALAAAAPEPRFEVASIRPVRSATEMSLTTSGPRLTAKCYSASELIGYAFAVEDYQIQAQNFSDASTSLRRRKTVERPETPSSAP